jgi:hypothetical protein
MPNTYTQLYIHCVFAVNTGWLLFNLNGKIIYIDILPALCNVTAINY